MSTINVLFYCGCCLCQVPVKGITCAMLMALGQNKLVGVSPCLTAFPVGLGIFAVAALISPEDAAFFNPVSDIWKWDQRNSGKFSTCLAETNEGSSSSALGFCLLMAGLGVLFGLNFQRMSLSEGACLNSGGLAGQVIVTDSCFNNFSSCTCQRWCWLLLDLLFRALDSGDPRRLAEIHKPRNKIFLCFCCCFPIL